MKIAPLAGKREVVQIINAAVLPRYDVFYVVCQFAILLGQTAVFAPLTCSITHKASRLRIHAKLQIDRGVSGP